MDIIVQSQSRQYQLIPRAQAVQQEQIYSHSLSTRESAELLNSARPIQPQKWSDIWSQLNISGAYRAASDTVIIEQIKSLASSRKVFVKEVKQVLDPSMTGSVERAALSRGAKGGEGKSKESLFSSSASSKDKASALSAPQSSTNKLEEHMALNSDAPPKDAQASVKECAVEGEPISMISGEELLQICDAELPGPMPYRWMRTYRSSNPKDVGMGHGWTHSGCERVDLHEKVSTYCDNEGREIPFKTPSNQQVSKYSPEGLSLVRVSENSFILKKQGDWDKVFSRNSKRTHSFKLTQVRHPHYDCQTGSGFAINFHYDEKNTLIKIQSNWGKSLVLTRSDTGKIRRVSIQNECTGNHKKLADYVYSKAGDLIVHRNAGEAEETYEYTNHLIVCRTLKTGFKFYFEWDGEDHRARCLRNWGDRNIYNYTFRWDTQNKRSYATDSRGYTKEYHYNEYGQIIKEIDNEGGVHNTKFTKGKKVSYTNPEGHTTRYFYDRENNPCGTENALGYRFSISYFNGLPTTITDKDNSHWRREYNDQGLLTSLINPFNQAVRYTYGSHGLLSSVLDQQGTKTQYHWNKNGELSSTVDGDGHRREFKYDEWSQMVSSELFICDSEQESTAGKVEFVYTATGQVEKIVSASGDVTNHQYNNNDQLIWSSDPQGRITEFKYDGLNQLVERIDSEGYKIKYEYDTERNLIAIVNQNRDRYQFFYDGNERLIKEIGFDGRIQEYSYDRAGHLVKQVDAGTVLTEFQRDALGQLLRKTSSVEHSKISTRFSYDPNGRISEAYNGSQYLSFSYNALGRVSREHHCDLNDKMQRVQSSMDEIEFIRTDLGALSGITLPDGKVIDYAFDARNRLTDVKYNKQNIAHIERDLLGREVARSQGETVTMSEYDPSGRLQKQHSYNKKQKRQGPIHREYSYNAFGNLDSLIDGKNETLFIYDFNDRLKKTKGLTAEVYDFDPASNLLYAGERSKCLGQSEGNRLLLQGDCHYYYDERGNLIQKKRGKGGKLQTKFEYNSENQLIRTVKNGQITYYKYDPLGRRIEKSDSFGSTKYLWVGEQLTQETRNNIKKTYVYEPESFKPVAMIQNEQVFHYHLDHIGTPQELSNQQGDVVWKARYKTYGNIALQEVSEVENNLRFQGQYFDEETGLHYNRHRYYNPDTGQFTTQDPIGLLGGLNNYQYAPNPIAWVDPLGLSCKELPSHVLNEENLLGAGAFKEAFIIDDESVFLIPKRVVHHNRPHTIEDLKQEAFLLNYLSGSFNLPTLNMSNLGYVNMPDGTVVEGLVAERKLFNGKDVDTIRRGKSPQGISLADVYDAVTPETLSELEKMRDIIKKENIVIKDFQVMFGKDGLPVIADPLDAYAGKSAEAKEVDETLGLLENNIIMIEKILNKK